MKKLIELAELFLREADFHLYGVELAAINGLVFEETLKNALADAKQSLLTTEPEIPCISEPLIDGYEITLISGTRTECQLELNKVLDDWFFNYPTEKLLYVTDAINVLNSDICNNENVHCVLLQGDDVSCNNLLLTLADNLKCDRIVFDCNLSNTVSKVITGKEPVYIIPSLYRLLTRKPNSILTYPAKSPAPITYHTLFPHTTELSNGTSKE